MAPNRAPAAAVKWNKNSFKYGMPLYGVAWPEGNFVYVCGGGGHGIKNRVVVAKSKRGCLTDQVSDYSFGQDCPMRMVVCPEDKSIIVAMGSGGIRHLQVDSSDKKKPRLFEHPGALHDRVAAIKGDVKGLAFDATGRHLALGCADGSVTVLQWPSLKPKMQLSGDSKLPSGVRDLSFSYAATVVAVALDDGSCELHDWDKPTQLARLAPGKEKLRGERIVVETRPDNSTLVHHLPAGMGGVAFMRVVFSRGARGGDLYAVMVSRESGAWLTCWKDAGVLGQPLSLGLSSHASPEPGTSLANSRDGVLLAMGTSEGSLLVARAADLRVVRRAPKAHMVFATCTTFCDRPGAAGHQALSGSADASAYVMELAPRKRNYKKIVMATLLAVTVFMFLMLLALRVLKATGQFYRLEALLDTLGLPNFMAARRMAWEALQRQRGQQGQGEQRWEQAPPTEASYTQDAPGGEHSEL